VTFEDAGWYKCVAINTIGKSEKKIYVDVVRGKRSKFIDYLMKELNILELG